MAVAGVRYGPDALADPDDNTPALLVYQYILALLVLELALAGMMGRSWRLVSAVLLLAIGVLSI